jgi:DeoR/GlpR family transcriptional regulator of sugar metabolism
MATDTSIDDRRSKVFELLASKGFAKLTEIVQTLNVSESTARRDLEVLEEQGLARRTHGGAILTKDTAGHRMAFSERQSAAVPQKQAIARAVSELIGPDQTIMLDGGTTCYEVARALHGRRISVITNSVPIASLLSTDLATEVTLVGGYVYPRTGVTIGATAEAALAELHASQLVLSCAGVAPEGIFNANQMMVDVERAMMRAVDRVILAVDHTKLGKRAVVKLCEFGAVGVIVTDADVDIVTRGWLDSLGVRIIYAA